MHRSDTKESLYNRAIHFIRERPFLVAAAAFLFLVSVGVLLSLALLSGSDQDGIAEPAVETGPFTAEGDIAEVAEVLPQQRRESSDMSQNELWPSAEPIIDPFSDPMRLTGILLSGRGGEMAIVESSGTSYIVTVGDYVDDLWAVRQISREMVILRAYNQEVTLFLDQPPVTRNLDIGTEEEDDGEDGA